MTREEALTFCNPGELEWAVQLRREDAGSWQARWVDGLGRNIGADPATVAGVIESYLAEAKS